MEDRKTACYALPVPNFYGTVWKYRFESSDMGRGQSGGFRVMAHYSEQENTLYPFCIYTHVDYPSQPPKKDLRAWLKGMLSATAGVRSVEAKTTTSVTCIICGSPLSEYESDAFGDRCANRLQI